MGYVKNYLQGVQELLAQVSEADVDAVIDLLWDNYQSGRRVVFCGNGGSASTASHLPADFQKNMYLDGGRPWECLSVVDSVPLLTAWGNDTDYANVFAGQVRCWLRPGDLLVAISGSGNSPNILSAVEAAHDCGAVTIGLSGFGGGKLADMAHHSVVIHSRNMQMVEDVHMVLGHVLYSALRDRLLADKEAHADKVA
ncbi:MAG: SIS domain-containing protein [Armatimonadota bacterium]|nr:SIS domain-containing protein [Armatimonadota bacterium]